MNPLVNFFERHGVHCPSDRPCLSAADKMIRERKTSRSSVVGVRIRASSACKILQRQPDFRSLGIIPMLNHESAFGKTGY